MSSRPKVLGLIPARGGSKGIPRKNIRLLDGKPLIAYAIEAALRCRLLDRVVVSTDDEEIAETLQISIGTVKSRIARGREELRRRLKDLI